MKMMNGKSGISWAIAATLALGVGAAIAFAADDDLDVVKKAVASHAAQASAAPAQSAAPAARPAAKARSEAQWFKVRVSERENNRKVTINLPLSLVRALGDELPVDIGCDPDRGHDRGHRLLPCGISLSKVLAELDAGQSLVEIDSDEETVRVWIE
jgi:hypothetical protein